MDQHMVDSLLEQWFGKDEDRDSPEEIERRIRNLWFVKDEENDKKITRIYGEHYYKASKGEYDSLKSTPKGRLLLIILLDQIPRNMFRDSDLMFKTDDQALKIALEGIHNFHDTRLKYIERVFFYLPLEHSEDLTYQHISVKQFQKLLNESPKKLKDHFENTLEIAVQHKKIIEQFGRFPHRNATLGRFSTKEEQEFLSLPGSSF